MSFIHTTAGQRTHTETHTHSLAHDTCRLTRRETNTNTFWLQHVRNTERIVVGKVCHSDSMA